MESTKREEEFKQLMRLADFQEWFINRYSLFIEDENLRECFRRELLYMIQLTYREAQQPFVQQLTDFCMTQNRPLIFEKP